MASHCLCPQQAPERGSYQPGQSENAIAMAVAMTTSHEPQDRYWGTWAGDPGERKWVSRGAGCGVLWNLGFPLLTGLPAK